MLAGDAHQGGGAVTIRAALLATVLVLAPLGARAADLLVWWEKGFYPEEDQAVRELVAAFERKTGKKVELAFDAQQSELPGRTEAAGEGRRPPDLVYGLDVALTYFARWAHEDRLVDLADALGPLAAQFDKDALDRGTLLDAAVGERGLYALPMGRVTNHVHVWRSLLERAGLTLADVPREWEPFWSFWCDRVQPAVRNVTGREDVWGVGLSMSTASYDTDLQFRQFMHAYEADYVTRDGRLVIDEPGVRDRLVQALAAYTAIWRKGCTPPASLGWKGDGNNEAFLAGSVVMTPNTTLSIPGALRTARPEDYYRNAATVPWPLGAYGQPLAVVTFSSEAVVFRGTGHEATATAFVLFLVVEGWLAHWLDFAGDRFLPPLPALLEQPFWLDPGDPHRMASAMQFLTRPRRYAYEAASGDWRHGRVDTERVWATAVHRVVVDGLTPTQAVDEAIARVHQILSE